MDTNFIINVNRRQNHTTVDLSVWPSSISCRYLQLFEEENKLTDVNIIAIYGTMIYMALYVKALHIGPSDQSEVHR